MDRNLYFSSLLIPLRDGARLLLHHSGERATVDDAVDLLPQGWAGVIASESKSILFKPEPSPGFQRLAIHENCRYTWILEGEGKLSTSPDRVEKILEQPVARETRGTLCVRNFLGTANLAHDGVRALSFDIVSAKIDYETEYRSMVEAIAAECNQLLMQWNSPTLLDFSHAQEEHKTLLEQFIFLRHVLSSEKLDLFIETIHRNPHNKLAEELHWQATGTEDPHPRIYEDPLGYADGWSRTRHVVFPQRILAQRKYESFDTPANQFVKFAIKRFNRLCRDVIDHKCITGSPVLEAEDMQETLEGFLRLSIFDEVAELTSVPLNNQTLQKREGYRDILHAWLMLDLAAKLDWEGRQEFFEGGSRDVPTLYEYWLFFKIRHVLSRLDGMVHNPQKTAEDFINENDHLTMRLKQGRKSVCKFVYHDKLNIDFYYNRTFGSKADVLTHGSYSRQFRPDFSLVIYPRDKSEVQAAKSGDIAYLHLDAKYRVEKLYEVFGKDTDQDDVLDEEKRDTALNTYKRGDLYKMHTYNEAIRRTVGSYVLYPGSETNADPNSQQFSKYHELLPGVGAFALKPSSNEAFEEKQLDGIRSFIRDALSFQESRFSQLYRINYWTHDTVKEEPSNYMSDHSFEFGLPPADTSVIVGYVRPEFQFDCRSKSTFYFHAIDQNGKPSRIDQRILNASHFIPYTTSKDQEPPWLGWYAMVKRCELVSRQKLIDDGFNLKSRTKFYYKISLADFRDTEHPLMPLPTTKRPMVKTWADLWSHE